MRKQTLAIFTAISFFALCCGALTYAADAPGRQFAGTWLGTWEGGGTGKFELILETGGDGKVAGSVNVGTDGGDYTAKFTSLSLDGNKLSGKYTFPLDEQGEVTVAGTLEGNKLVGTWALGPKGQEGQAFANGTWTVSKK